jgi:hypothetical protein
VTDRAVRAILRRLDSLQRQLASVNPLTQWPTVREACEQYNTSRETLRKLANRNVIRQSREFPVRYYRPDLDRHFFGLVPEEMAS